MRSPPRLHASRIKYHACESKEHHGGEEEEVTGGGGSVGDPAPRKEGKAAPADRVAAVARAAYPPVLPSAVPA